MTHGILVTLPDETLEAIAQRAADICNERPATPAAISPYLTTDQAADYLRCTRQRIHDLLTQGKLSRLKEGRRTLVLRSEIEQLVEVDRRRRSA